MSARETIAQLKERVSASINRQEHVVDRRIIGLLANGSLRIPRRVPVRLG